jgi:hypothetical protein
VSGRSRVVLRLIVAPSTGLRFDLDYFRTQTVRLTLLGPSHFCDSGFPADPPGCPLLLLGLSQIDSLLGGGVPATRLLKMPSIVADLGIAWIAGVFAVRLEGNGGGRRDLSDLCGSHLVRSRVLHLLGCLGAPTDPKGPYAARTGTCDSQM